MSEEEIAVQINLRPDQYAVGGKVGPDMWISPFRPLDVNDRSIQWREDSGKPLAGEKGKSPEMCIGSDTANVDRRKGSLNLTRIGFSALRTAASCAVVWSATQDLSLTAFTVPLSLVTEVGGQGYASMLATMTAISLYGKDHLPLVIPSVPVFKLAELGFHQIKGIKRLKNFVEHLTLAASTGLVVLAMVSGLNFGIEKQNKQSKNESDWKVTCVPANNPPSVPITELTSALKQVGGFAPSYRPPLYFPLRDRLGNTVVWCATAPAIPSH